MSKYLAQKQTLLKICTSHYKSEIDFLMAFLYIHSTKYTINKQTYVLNPQSTLQQSCLYEHSIRPLLPHPQTKKKHHICLIKKAVWQTTSAPILQEYTYTS